MSASRITAITMLQNYREHSSDQGKLVEGSVSGKQAREQEEMAEETPQGKSTNEAKLGHGARIGYFQTLPSLLYS